LKSVPTFDIIIDDGGHTMNQQIITFQCIYNHMTENGVYLCEDLHTSYWKEFGGGLKNPNSFIEFSKNIIDCLNADHLKLNNDRYNKNNASNLQKHICQTTNSITYYDSVVVFEKYTRNGPMTFSIK
jgi:hypothetical protein